MAINWNKKGSVLKTWGAGLGALFLLTQIFQGTIFSGTESFGVDILLATFMFALPPFWVFLLYWPRQKIAASPAPAPTTIPTTPASGWNKKRIWLVLLGIFIAYKLIISLYIGHQKSELNGMIQQLQQR